MTIVQKIVSDLEKAIQKGSLSQGDALPSLATLQNNYSVSRDTGIRVYKNLKARGIAVPVHGKGYFLQNRSITTKINLFLLLDSLSSYKDTLVKNVSEAVSEKGKYRIYFHHHNEELFYRLIEEAKGNYTHYAISPYPDSSLVQKALQLLPNKKVTLLDRCDGIPGTFNFIGQDFKKDVYDGLVKLSHRIRYYSKFIFVFRNPSHHPQELKIGFQKFCIQTAIDYEIVSKVAQKSIRPGTAFLVIDDEDLADVVTTTTQMDHELGKDIGLVSYNETILKEIVGNGITTISTDFAQMGKLLVSKLGSSKPYNIHNGSMVKERKSI